MESIAVAAERVKKAGNRQKADLLRKYGEAVAALLSGVLLLIAWLTEPHFYAAAVALYLAAFVIGGFAKAKEGLHTLVAERDLDVNLLMIVAAVGAAAIGYWAEGAMLIFIFALSGALESYTMAKSHRDISALMELKPETAVLYKDGCETVVPIERLAVGDVVLVKPGERIPADGVVAEGESAVNQASITGESVPVDKVPGDEVYAGTLNGQGALFVKVSKPSESTLFAKIIKLVQEAESEKPASQHFIEKFERIYARAVIVLTVLLIVLPPLLLQWTWDDTFYKAMVFLVVASPCALVASIMPATLAAISSSARNGVLFKGGVHLENLAGTRVVAFDKTGTLTYGKPVVTDLLPYQGYSEEELLQIAASIESLSEHPLARAIVEAAAERGVSITRPNNLQALVGWGVQAEYKGETWKIGKPQLADGDGLTDEQAAEITRLGEQGKTVTVMVNARGVAGIIAMRDTLRPEAKRAVALLKQMGIRAAMLTGDHAKTAAAVAEEAGIDIVYAELLPEDKVKCIKELKSKYGPVAMVGDGVNDAPALAAATVGAAMGGKGSDAALETADLVLMNDDIGKIAQAIHLGRQTRTVILQNIGFAISVIILLIAGNFFQGIALPLGVIGHEGSTILVILNGLRLLKPNTVRLRRDVQPQ